jgi:hypothetical protein
VDERQGQEQGPGESQRAEHGRETEERAGDVQ